ncbi:MAG: radical SAM protein [Methanobrevibacter sp.]|nr:radical SAM protein [Methanobrevibacter sp.]
MFNEKNIIKKNPLKINLRFASVYPNIYRVAMSSLGYQIIYGLANEREDTWCERVIYPGNRSLESNSPLNDFDIISFTLHYEQDYFNLIETLKKSNIPLKKEDRDDTYPMIICGGPTVSSNPLPISDFIDLFIIGEAEAILNKFLNRYQELNNPKKEINSFLDIDGIYIYDNPVKRTIIKDMKDAYQVTNPIITETDNQDFMPVFGNAITLNVSRGCIRGCRFCMTGYTCRPLRETSLKILLKTVDEVREKTGLKKVLLTGAAVSDYSKIDELTSKLLNKGFQISTSSLRVESTSYETLNNLKISGLKTITIAPESIYSLRKTLNKNISDLKIDELIKTALDMNFNIKFYFLLGILNESMADIKELSKYIKYINSIKYDRNNLKQAKIKFSFNPLIPKPHTPFQWQKYDFKDIKNKIRFLRKDLRRLSVKFDSPKMGLIQYVLSCKGREISNLIAETTDERRLKDFKINLNKWNEHSTPFSLNDKLPWKNIDNGISEDFLKKEHEKML